MAIAGSVDNTMNQNELEANKFIWQMRSLETV